MISASRARARTQFAEVEKRQKKLLDEHDEALLAQRKNTERLKALRLAREAAERTEKSRIKALKAAKTSARRRA